MKIVYICERPHNLYRTLLKAVNSDDEMDLVLSNNFPGMDLMIDELRKSKLFRNVFFFNNIKHKTFIGPLDAQKTFSAKNIADIKRIVIGIFYMIAGLFDYLISQRKARKITLPDNLDFDIYDEIHITDCTSILNFYLYRKKYDNIVYVEHSKNGLQGQPSVLAVFLYILVKLRVIYGIRGTCRYISAIEVNENVDLTWETRGKEIREIPLGMLYDNLLPKQAELIYQLYAKSYNLTFPEDSTVDFFLTTTIIIKKSPSFHVKVCKEAIKKYMSDADFIVIKPHPFDKTDYSEVLHEYENAMILPPYFSAEIFALSSTLKIRKMVNIDTSAVDAFSCAKEVVTLGHEFVEKCMDV